MSNPDKNPFEHTSDPDLDPPSNMDTAGQTVDGADLTRQAETAKKKNAAKTKVVLLVVGVFAAFAVFQIGSSFWNVAPAKPVSAMKPANTTVPAVAAPATPAPALTIPDPTPAASQASAAPALTLPATPFPATTSGAQGDGVSVSINGGAQPQSTASTPPAPLTLEPPKVNTPTPNAASLAPPPAVTAKPVTPTTDTTQFAKQEDLSNLTKRVDVLETEVSGLKQLEGRIKKVEERGVSGGGKTRVIYRTAHKATIKGEVKDALVKVEKESKDHRPGFWLDDDAVSKKVSSAVTTSVKTASSTLNMDGGASSDVVPEGNRRAPAAPYQLVAIMQDRAWVKQADGSMQTVQEGEVLPNGAKVLKIDPKKDEVRTSAGILR
jgi:hypothetical protein